jgi:hypothetical protein
MKREKVLERKPKGKTQALMEQYEKGSNGKECELAHEKCLGCDADGEKPPRIL